LALQLLLVPHVPPSFVAAAPPAALAVDGQAAPPEADPEALGLQQVQRQRKGRKHFAIQHQHQW
jgi:hypothetical protein